MKILIIGNNSAGITTAKKIRDLDPGAEIVVVSAEDFPFYTRPRLINLISGESEEKDLYFYEPEWYEKNKIAVRLSTTVTGIRPAEKTVLTGSGPFSFDRLILACGADSFLPPLSNHGLENIFTLRTIRDAQKIREQALRSSRIVVIGGGVLGLESANAIRKISPSGEITVVEVMDQLLPRQLDKPGAEVLGSILLKNRIKLITSAKVRGFHGEGRVASVELEDRTLEADMAIVSAGVRPNISCLAGSGIRTNRGILVDHELQTSEKGIFAAGDCAEYEGRVYGMIRPAMDMAGVAAANALQDGSSRYNGSPVWNTLKTLGVFVVSMGEYSADNAEGFEIIRVPKAGTYRKYILKNGILAGFISIGGRISEPKVQKLISDAVNVSKLKEKFKDPGFEF
jgi:nitrite reductase (NADH) large subunit